MIYLIIYIVIGLIVATMAVVVTGERRVKYFMFVLVLWLPLIIYGIIKEIGDDI
jgi:hypothetical protein